MEDITTLEKSHVSNFPYIVTLDAFQYSHYQSSCLEVHTPDGDYLTSIGNYVQRDEIENNKSRLREQVSLLACLLESVDGGIQLSEQAVLGLTNLLDRVQELCDAK